MTLDCNKCGERFVLDNTHLGVIKEGDLEVRFFRCPACGWRYNILTTDSKMRDLIDRRNAVQSKIRLAKAKKFKERTFRKYMQELDQIKKEQEKLMPELKAQGEKILHGGEQCASTELHDQG